MLSDASLFKNVTSDSEGITVNIGDVDGNPDVSMVSAKFKVGNEGEQTLTLLGPTRMDYAKVLSALEYIVDELNKYFDKGGN